MKSDQNRLAGSALADLAISASQAKRALLCVATLLPAVLVWGCAGIVSGQTSSPAAPTAQSFSISGTISPVTGGGSATVTLSGAANATTTADGSGDYVFSGLKNGTYAVTPSHTGYTFNPSVQAATLNGANVTGLNFAAMPQQAHSVALSWIAGTSTVAGYNVYRSTVSGTQYAKVNDSLVGGLVFTDTTVLGGTIYYYVATAVDASGNESAFSNEAQAIIP